MALCTGIRPEIGWPCRPGAGNGMLQTIMHRLCTREKILCTGIMHSIMHRAPTRNWLALSPWHWKQHASNYYARTEYARVRTYYARGLCTALCTGLPPEIGRPCRPGTGHGMLQTIMRGLCTRDKILCTGIMHDIMHGAHRTARTSADWSKLYVILK